MSGLKITFLGTGTSQGVPVIGCKCKVCRSGNEKDNRTRTSIVVEDGEHRFIIDTGPDFRLQCLRESIEQIDAIVLTHEHKDHIAGLDDVRAFNFVLKKEIPVYASKQVIEALKREFAYIFADTKYPGIPQIKIIEIRDKPFQIGAMKITPIEVMHYKMPVKAFRINDFAYVTDANSINEAEKKKLLNLDVLVLNALRKETHISHFNLEEALGLISELKPKKAYITHLSHQMGTHNEVSAELLPNVELAFDGLQLII